MSRDRGRFIVLEGVEGAGKSTAMAVVEETLGAAGFPPVVTREPGGTPLGEAIRELLLGHRHAEMSDATEVLLVFAARAEHIEKRIRPALEAGTWVLCDRFTDATYAYQGAGRGMPEHRLATLENWVQGDLRPDLVLILDVPVREGLDRASRRGGAPDRFESQREEFFQRVRNAYLARAAADSARYRLIDASRPVEDVAATLRAVLGEWLRDATDAN